MGEWSWLVSFLLAVGTGGFIGWLTNLIAIHCLFHPHEPKDFFFFSLQGLLPKRQPELAENIGKIIEGELVSLQELAGSIHPEDFDPIIQRALNKFCQEQEESLKAYIEAKVPFLGKLGAEGVIRSMMENLHGVLFRAIRPRVPEIIEQAAGHIAEKISVREMVADKLRTMDLDRIEKIVYKISDKEMEMLVWMGGVLGMIVGAIQWVLQVLIR